ncbi:hypothetical protein C3766_05175 [Heyndrickxia coagulans]|nr:hypothetical protein C3766_05175 [Heyndrickxia coagulans]
MSLSKGQNRLDQGSNCLFEAVKRTKGVAIGLELSFWGCQKDKTCCVRGQTVFLNLSKRQNRLRPGSNCLFDAAKRTKGVTFEPEMSF